MQNSSDGYRITLDSNTPVEPKAVTGSDGHNYYQIGEPIVMTQTSPSVTATGRVNCSGTTWSGGVLGLTGAWHRLFIYLPPTGIKIGTQNAYRINSNVVMTITEDLADWQQRGGSMCQDLKDYSTTASVSTFSSQFPITFTFYLNEKVIDGQIVIPGMDLAGYVRAFNRDTTKPTQTSWTIQDTTAPMRLNTSQLNLVSSCSTQTHSGAGGTGTGTLNLNHGTLKSNEYDSLVSGQVNYNCTFSTSTPIRLRLNYAKDGDPQGRLPLTNTAIGTTDKIYTELTMRDETTGQTGGVDRDIHTDIEQSKTISITSHLQGTDAVAGNYQGSAWLIATFD
ncbi:adhesin [Acinetobacter sp. S54]|nr:adhesin [Acinetobacter sp. S55]MBK0065350.1 adhesin [Acinetobacter sp. S54]